MKFIYEEYIPAIKELLELYIKAKAKNLVVPGRKLFGISTIEVQMQLGQEANGCPLCKVHVFNENISGCGACPWSTAFNSEVTCRNYKFDSFNDCIKRLENWLKFPVKIGGDICEGE